MNALSEEASRFQYLGSHDNLVLFKGVHQHGIMFEYCARGELAEVIQSQPLMTYDQKMAFGKQVILELIHLHRHNFIHCELNVNNIFVTSAMIAKIGDIQGQLYRADGTVEMPTIRQENAMSRHPHADEDEFSPRTDIFALGTVLYHLWHGHPPLPDLDEYEEEAAIRARYRAGQYPIDGARAKGTDKIISKCWNSCYPQANDVLEDMNLLQAETRGWVLPSSLLTLLQRASTIWRGRSD